jgi:hypothetical protein
MNRSSRAIAASLAALGLVCAAGCSSKPPPAAASDPPCSVTLHIPPDSGTTYTLPFDADDPIPGMMAIAAMLRTALEPDTEVAMDEPVALATVLFRTKRVWQREEAQSEVQVAAMSFPIHWSASTSLGPQTLILLPDGSFNWQPPPHFGAVGETCFPSFEAALDHLVEFAHAVHSTRLDGADNLVPQGAPSLSVGEFKARFAEEYCQRRRAAWPE